MLPCYIRRGKRASTTRRRRSVQGSAVKKIRTKSLMREVAYERFKAELFKRNLVPGQFVSQGELCELLDVPLGPTREALKRLEAESLVRLIPQRGIQIADIGVTLVHEAFEFRTIIELAAVRRFAVEASDAVLEGLERDTAAILQRMKAGGEVDSRLLDAALQADWGMHNAIVEGMGNRITMNAHQQNFDKIKMIRLHGRSPRYLPLALEEHLAVIAALKARDPDRAAEALRRHLECAERRALGL
jgi:DNA-binding GntR family transcriptional regulator